MLETATQKVYNKRNQTRTQTKNIGQNVIENTDVGLHIHEDKVFEYCITETEEKKWTVYYKHGTQFHFEDELDFHEFNYKLSTLTQIKLLSNRTQYGEEPVQVEEEDHLPHVGTTNTWENFVSKQSPWMQQMLERVHFCDKVPIPFKICDECEKNDGLLVISRWISDFSQYELWLGSSNT